ncbi:MAG: aldo/keto reductase [Propionibacteriaceae bacterium]
MPPVAFGPIVLGGNRFGSSLDVDASYALLDRHLEQGGTMVDTALVYADWLPDVERACSERLLGRWLASRGVADTVVVATKGGHPEVSATGTAGRRPPPRLDPASLRRDVSASLDHLGLGCLPLWWLHRDDPRRPVADILHAVEDLRSAGLLAAWGVANWTAGRLAELRAAAAAAGVDGPLASSVCFALAPPAPGVLADDLVVLDAGLAVLHEQTQLPLVAYSAQAKGWLERAARGEPSAHDPVYDHGATRTLATALARLGGELGASPTEVALAAVALLPFPTSAVVGPGTPTQLDSCWAASRLTLDETQRAVLRPWIDAAVAAAGAQPLTEPEVRPATR